MASKASALPLDASNGGGTAAMSDKTCCCNLPGCQEFRLEFGRLGDELRSGNCLLFDLGGTKPQKVQHRNAILKTLGVSEAVFNAWTENMKSRVRIAKIHFDPRQLELFKENARARSTLVTASQMEQYTIAPAPADPNDLQWRGGKVFHLPNYPMSQVQNDINGLKSGRQGRAERRWKEVAEQEQLRADEESAQEATLRRQEFDDLQFEGYVDEQKKASDKISCLEAKVQKLEKKLEEKNKKLRAKARSVARAVTPKKASSDELSESYVVDLLKSVTQKYGGLSRLTLGDDKWHNRNKNAASILFGFKSWEETKEHMHSLFDDLPEFEYDRVLRHILKKQKERLRSTSDSPEKGGKGGKGKTHVLLTPFEQCLATKMFMHSIPVRNKVAAIFGVTSQRMGQIIQKWAPRWGKAGEYLSCVILTEEYLASELPNIYRLLGFELVIALLDGKDYICHVKRKDDKKRRSQMSDKMHAAAARDITWTTPAGLCFEYTKLFGGRISEKRLVELWGSLGQKFAPIEEWKDYAIKSRSSIPKYRKLTTATDQIDNSCLSEEVVDLEMEEGEDASMASASSSEDDDEDFMLAGEDAVMDDDDSENEDEDYEEDEQFTIEVVEVDTSEEREEFDAIFGAETAENAEQTEGRPAIESPGETQTLSQRQGQNAADDKIDIVGNILTFLSERKKAISNKARLANEGKTTAMVDTADELEAAAVRALKSSPQSNPVDLLLQLECHERLHQKYQAKVLSPCLLSFYLEEMTHHRRSLLHWLGSSMVSRDYGAKYGDPPRVPLRLNKLLAGYELLGDKGFDGTDRLNPNMNPVRTPLVLRTRGIKHYLVEELFGPDGKRNLCKLRYTSEVAFSRATDVDGLKDVIQYDNIKILPHLHAWGHAMMNLGQPLREPGKISNSNN